MPVYYDDNEAIFDFITDIIDREENFCFDSYAFGAYVWGGASNEKQLLTVDEKIAYEDVIYQTLKRFPQLSQEDAELYLMETIQISEEEFAEEFDWQNELQSLMEAIHLRVNSDLKPTVSLVLEGHRDI